jgi:hypothetical protein
MDIGNIRLAYRPQIPPWKVTSAFHSDVCEATGKISTVVEDPLMKYLQPTGRR